MAKVKVTTMIEQETYDRLTNHGKHPRGVGRTIDELAMYEGLCIFCQAEEVKALLAKQREGIAEKNRTRCA